MVSNYPHAVAQNDRPIEAGVARAADGIGARVLDKMRQAICGLHGHDALLQFEKDRMFLRCVSCGHETPGWEITEAPAVTAREDSRPALVAPRFVDARRIA